MCIEYFLGSTVEDESMSSDMDFSLTSSTPATECSTSLSDVDEYADDVDADDRNTADKNIADRNTADSTFSEEDENLATPFSSAEVSFDEDDIMAPNSNTIGNINNFFDQVTK